MPLACATRRKEESLFRCLHMIPDQPSLDLDEHLWVQVLQQIQVHDCAVGATVGTTAPRAPLQLPSAEESVKR